MLSLGLAGTFTQQQLKFLRILKMTFKPEIIRVSGDYIELDNIRVAEILDIDASTRYRLEEYINYANDYREIKEVADSLRISLSHQEKIASKAYNEGKIDGYAEGRADVNSN
jgi:hypothetical protein